MINWTELFLSSGFTLTAVLLFLFIHPEKFEHWMALFYKSLYPILSKIPLLFNRIDRLAVASSIQDIVNGTCEHINKEAPGVVPHAIKIDWVSSENPESFIKKNQVIVRLRYYENQDKNIVDATLLYLKVGFLPRARHYLDKCLLKSCELRTASKIFLAKRDTGAYDYFYSNELFPVLQEEPDIKNDLQVLEEIDTVGLYTGVFLSEIKQIEKKILGTIPTEAIKQEIRSFLKFLQNIAKKEKRDVPLSFMGAKIKCSIVLVAKRDTILSYGIDPYVNRISRLVREGYDSIYISGWGEEFAKDILEIKRKTENTLLRVLYRNEIFIPKGNAGITKGLLITCQSNSSYLAKQRELQNEVIQAMNEVVPEIKQSIIDIVSIARVKDVGFKVAVRPASENNTCSVTTCIGKKLDRLNDLKNKFPSEFIGIALWSDDPKKFILSALSPLKPRQVSSIELDDDNMVANVKVNNKESYIKALGKHGWNVKLANELTGWTINLDGPQKADLIITPEEELNTILSHHIHEIKQNQIKVVNIARIKGIGSKVVVKWNNESQKHLKMASEICRGESFQRLHTIQEETRGEWIYFHEWTNDEIQLIQRCIYPFIKHPYKTSIELDETQNLAVITVDQHEEEFIEETSFFYLALCEQVTGWNVEIITSTGHIFSTDSH